MSETVLRIGLPVNDARVIWVTAAREVTGDGSDAEVEFEELGPKTTRMRLKMEGVNPTEVLQVFADALRATGMDIDPPAVLVETQPEASPEADTEEEQPL